MTWWQLPVAAVVAVYAFIGVPLLLSTRLQRVHNAFAVAAIVLWALPVTLVLWLDQVLNLSRLPKSLADILAHPQTFFRILQASPFGKVPKDASLVTLVAGGDVGTEPAKRRTAFKLTVRYTTPRDAGAAHDLEVFVKTPSARGITLSMKMLSVIFVPEQREVAFYRSVAEHPALADVVVAPAPLAVRYERALYHILIVSEVVPDRFVSIPDWRGIDREQMTALYATGARMHAKFWRLPAAYADITSCLYDRRGLAWMSLVSSTWDARAVPWYRELWWALVKHFKDTPRMTVSHGDMRPGNMLFAPTPDGRRDAVTGTKWQVVFTDWEAMAVTPVMWDFLYGTMLGQSVAARRAHLKEQLVEYLGLLARHGVPAADLDVEQCELEMALLTLVLVYYSEMLAVVGGVGEPQGNTVNDCKEWASRILSALADLRPQVPRLAKLLGVPEAYVYNMCKEEVATPAADGLVL